jgi:hypothetical protein
VSKFVRFKAGADSGKDSAVKSIFIMGRKNAKEARENTTDNKLLRIFRTAYFQYRTTYFNIFFRLFI